MNERDPFNPDTPAGREWQRQERAREAVRAGRDPRAAPDGERAYGLLAQALAREPAPGLPADFARQVARRARATAEATDARVETGLLWALVACGLIAAAVVLFTGDHRWLLALGSAASGGPWRNPLVAAALLCLGGSAMAGRWLRPPAPGGDRHG